MGSSFCFKGVAISTLGALKRDPNLMNHPCRGFRLVFRVRETGSGDSDSAARLAFKGLGV